MTGCSAMCITGAAGPSPAAFELPLPKIPQSCPRLFATAVPKAVPLPWTSNRGGWPYEPELLAPREVLGRQRRLLEYWVDGGARPFAHSSRWLENDALQMRVFP